MVTPLLYEHVSLSEHMLVSDMILRIQQTDLDLFGHTKTLCFAEYAQDKRFKWWRDNRIPFSPHFVPITREHAFIDPEALRTVAKALRRGRDIWRCVKEAVEDIYAERIRPDAHEHGNYWDVPRSLWIIVDDVWIITVLLYGMGKWRSHTSGDLTRRCLACQAGDGGVRLRADTERVMSKDY